MVFASDPWAPGASNFPHIDDGHSTKIGSLSNCMPPMPGIPGIAQGPIAPAGKGCPFIYAGDGVRLGWAVDAAAGEFPSIFAAADLLPADGPLLHVSHRVAAS